MLLLLMFVENGQRMGLSFSHSLKKKKKMRVGKDDVLSAGVGDKQIQSCTGNLLRRRAEPFPLLLILLWC